MVMSSCQPCVSTKREIREDASDWQLAFLSQLVLAIRGGGTNSANKRGEVVLVGEELQIDPVRSGYTRTR